MFYDIMYISAKILNVKIVIGYGVKNIFKKLNQKTNKKLNQKIKKIKKLTKN
jgi:hypothetical protein